MVMDDDSDLGPVLELSRGMDGSDEDGLAGGCRRGRRRDSDEPNELGVFSMFATTVPERGDGERPATVRGMVWRTVLLFAWYVGVYVANIWYYLAGHGEYERASLAILSWFGVRWHDTWLGDWGGPIVWIVVLMFSSCAPLHVSTLLIVNGFTGRRCRPFCLLAALLMPVGVAGMLTEPVLKHTDWGEDFPDMYPNIIPGLLTSMVCAALVAGLAFWSILRKRAGDEAKGRLARRLAVFSPGVPLLGMLTFEGLSGLGKAAAAFGMMLLLAAVVIPNELDGARWAIEHDRGAYWLWPAAIAVVGEFGLCVFGMVAIIYNLQ